MLAASCARVALGFLLVLSVSIKLANGDGSPPDHEQRLAKQEVADFLSRQGFQVDHAIAEQTDSPIVRAATDACSLLVIAAAPQGWHRNLLLRLAEPQDQTFFVVGGTLYEDQPLWRTWDYHYWRRANHLLGRRLPVHPVFGVVASRACDLRRIPWADVAAFP